LDKLATLFSFKQLDFGEASTPPGDMGVGPFFPFQCDFSGPEDEGAMIIYFTDAASRNTSLTGAVLNGLAITENSNNASGNGQPGDPGVTDDPVAAHDFLAAVLARVTNDLPGDAFSSPAPS
jgi:hypothetical protein